MKRFLRKDMRRDCLQSTLAILSVALFLAAPAFAQGAGNSPWENAVNVLETAFTSTIARGLSLVAIVVAGLTFAFGPLRRTSPTRSMSSSISSADPDADTFPKSSLSMDMTRIQTFSTTARCSWPSRITHDQQKLLHGAIPHRFGICPGTIPIER
jgi:type IV secretory pathway VirB2 component (pilin)